MPRVVDHQQRRTELVEAAWDLIIADGLPGVTIRRLAEASGWSSGAVRHYLPTRDAIVSAAADRVSEVIEARLRSALTAAIEGAEAWSLTAARAAVVEALLAIVPTDELSRRASLVWLAFAGQAASDRALADAHGALYRDLHEGLVEVLAGVIQDGGGGVVGGAESAATELQALVDGLTLHVLLGQLTAADARAVLTAAVQRLTAADATA